MLLQILTDFLPGVAYALVGFTGFIELWHTMNLAKTNRTKLPTAPFPVTAR